MITEFLIISTWLFIWFDAKRPSQHNFRNVEMFLSWTSTKQRIKCLVQEHHTTLLVDSNRKPLIHKSRTPPLSYRDPCCDKTALVHYVNFLRHLVVKFTCTFCMQAGKTVTGLRGCILWFVEFAVHFPLWFVCESCEVCDKALRVCRLISKHSMHHEYA